MNAIQAVDELIAAGWRWLVSDVPDPLSSINKGWWVKAGTNDVRQMRRGDPKNFHLAAKTTVELYEL